LSDDRDDVTREYPSMREYEPKKPGSPTGPSRRDFLRGSGVAAATAVLTGQATVALDEAVGAQAEPKVLSGTLCGTGWT
jgi:xanthine dehydrogenase YagT iron-sulfur-binding subunit